MQARGHLHALVLEQIESTQQATRTELLLSRQARLEHPLLAGLVEPAATGCKVPAMAGPVDRLRQQQRGLDVARQTDQAPVKSDMPTEQRPEDRQRLLDWV